MVNLAVYTSTKPKTENRISRYRSTFRNPICGVRRCLCPSVHCHSVALCGSRLRVPFPPDPAHAVGGVRAQVEHKLVRPARFPSRLISVFTLGLFAASLIGRGVLLSFALCPPIMD